MTARTGLLRAMMDTTCGFSTRPTVEPVPYCGAPAVLHGVTGWSDEDSSMYACAAHADTMLQLAADSHPLGGMCGIPDSMWKTTDEHGPGYCYWPAALDADQHATEQQLASA